MSDSKQLFKWVVKWMVKQPCIKLIINIQRILICVKIWSLLTKLIQLVLKYLPVTANLCWGISKDPLKSTISDKSQIYGTLIIIRFVETCKHARESEHAQHEMFNQLAVRLCSVLCNSQALLSGFTQLTETAQQHYVRPSGLWVRDCLKSRVEYSSP